MGDFIGREEARYLATVNRVRELSEEVAGVSHGPALADSLYWIIEAAVERLAEAGYKEDARRLTKVIEEVW